MSGASLLGAMPRIRAARVHAAAKRKFGVSRPAQRRSGGLSCLSRTRLRIGAVLVANRRISACLLAKIGTSREGSMKRYEYVTINVSGNDAKHVATFNETINRYAVDGWTVSQMVRPSVIGPLGVLFERDA
ncbi:hypothetical protein [Curtobacterium flaccumfaciens]|uniref:hypothetical protein n=1 Tax=Curtobacterium flaccumfaciens TaxID=2035 RepID=UPI001ADA907E|nr:hypothetical protein [Curtobacterium flaccumfaciens]MBO9051768.1 hypothetical protein [Curtobacterium flaccumfaciens pv. flaccumfaciens]